MTPEMKAKLDRAKFSATSFADRMSTGVMLMSRDMTEKMQKSESLSGLGVMSMSRDMSEKMQKSESLSRVRSSSTAAFNKVYGDMRRVGDSVVTLVAERSGRSGSTGATGVGGGGGGASYPGTGGAGAAYPSGVPPANSTNEPGWAQPGPPPPSYEASTGSHAAAGPPPPSYNAAIGINNQGVAMGVPVPSAP
eukprot:gene27379-4682_t